MNNMANTVVGIRFKAVGKKYYFDPQSIELEMYDKVVVETVRGIELGEVIETQKEIQESEIISTLKPVLRKATNKDLMDHFKNEQDIKAVIDKTHEHVRNNQLDMKLLGAEYTLDRNKLIIYFTAEGRVDFRELVKDLANEFHVRIELRQVGTRDGAKFLGGIGPCGYLICCTTFLGDFDTVSIKMAKNQNLSLNPTNISGLCGKLLCCIRYENDTYNAFKKTLPKMESMVNTPEGRGKVIGNNVIMQTVRVFIEGEGVRTFKVTELDLDKPKEIKEEVKDEK